MEHDEPALVERGVAGCAHGRAEHERVAGPGVPGDAFGQCDGGCAPGLGRGPGVAAQRAAGDRGGV